MPLCYLGNWGAGPKPAEQPLPRLLLNRASALGGQCRGTGVQGCAFLVHQLFLIWGGKMNLILVIATVFIDLGKCLAAPIHLPKANLIRARIMPHLSLGSAYATSLTHSFCEVGK